MRVRKTVALTGTVLFLIGCFLLYFLMDQTIIPQTAKYEDVSNNKWLHFEDRLRQLESSLSSHREAVDEIQQVVKKLKAPDKYEHHEMNVNVIPEVEHKKVQKVPELLVDQDQSSLTCPSVEHNVPESNVQMLQMYEKLPFDNPDGGVWKQGWNIHYEPEHWNRGHPLKVFVVPHSHNDPGWIHTVEEYFTAQTKKILNNVLTHLQEDPSRRFIWGEVSYLAMWWLELNTEQKRATKWLIQKGQLEIVNGGWVMPDEANSHWLNLAGQLSEGHHWLKKNLNLTDFPVNGWTIDPFGLSPTAALVYKQAGLKNLVIQRVHYSVKKQLALDKQLEFRWRQLWDSSGQQDILTHAEPFYSYDVPHTCGPDPKICCQFDFRRLPGHGLTCPWRIQPQRITENNVAHRAEMLLDQWRKKSVLYRSRSLLVPLGDDFRWDTVAEWSAQLDNYEKLFSYFRERPDLHVQAGWSTLKEYFDSLREEMEEAALPSLTGDFFTYADRDDHYWSGYYTSRPLYKRLDRVLMHYIRSASILHGWCVLDGAADDICRDMTSLLTTARQAAALFQHHDGVTGTARDHVVLDYSHKMLEGLALTRRVIQQASFALLSKPPRHQDFDFVYFDFITEEDSRFMSDKLRDKPTITLGHGVPIRTIVLWNSLTVDRQEIVSVYVSTPFVKVYDPSDRPLSCQVSPVWLWSSGVLQASSARYRLSCLVKVPALTLSAFAVQAAEPGDNGLPAFAEVHLFTDPATGHLVPDLRDYPGVVTTEQPRDFSIEGLGAKTVAFTKDGTLKAVTNTDGELIPVHLSFAKYGARKGSERSGAYLFLPDGPAHTMTISPETKSVVLSVKGPLEARVQVSLSHILHETIMRAAPGTGLDKREASVLEIHNLVDISDTHNTELVMRLATDIASHDEFFTDLNGLQMIRRKRFDKLPLQANYYPVPSAIYLQDSTRRLTVISGQALGGTSLKSGTIEIMQDRRLDQDDNRGLDQGVLDNKPVLHHFRVILESRKCHQDASMEEPANPAGYLSKEALLQRDSLHYPIDKMLYTQDGWPERMVRESSIRRSPSGTGLPARLPSGIFLGSVLVEKDTPAHMTLGLLLHRPQYDTCISGQADDEYNSMMNLTSLFNVRRPKSYRESSLTFLDTRGENHNPSKPLAMCPMDVKGVLVDF